MLQPKWRARRWLLVYRYACCMNDSLESCELHGWVIKGVHGWILQMVPILRAGLVLLEAAATVLPGSQTCHVGYVRDESTLEVRAPRCAAAPPHSPDI